MSSSQILSVMIYDLDSPTLSHVYGSMILEVYYTPSDMPVEQPHTELWHVQLILEKSVWFRVLS